VDRSLALKPGYEKQDETEGKVNLIKMEKIQNLQHLGTIDALHQTPPKFLVPQLLMVA